MPRLTKDSLQPYATGLHQVVDDLQYPTPQGPPTQCQSTRLRPNYVHTY